MLLTSECQSLSRYDLDELTRGRTRRRCGRVREVWWEAVLLAPSGGRLRALWVMCVLAR